MTEKNIVLRDFTLEDAGGLILIIKECAYQLRGCGNSDISVLGATIGYITSESSVDPDFLWDLKEYLIKTMKKEDIVNEILKKHTPTV